MAWFHNGKKRRPVRVTMHIENLGDGWKLNILGWETGVSKPTIMLVADVPAEIDDFFLRASGVNSEWLHHYHKIEKEVKP